MKVKTSITLSKTLLDAVDNLAGKTGNRSAVIEQAVREFVQKQQREARDARDLALFRRHADEFEDVIEDMLALSTFSEEAEP